MILIHPLPKKDGANKKAIAKYAGRMVEVKHGKCNMWLAIGCKSWVGNNKPHAIITFKDALKATKTFPAESRIEYHFIDNIGSEKPNIKDFDIEEVYNCPTITFDSTLEREFLIKENQKLQL